MGEQEGPSAGLPAYLSTDADPIYRKNIGPQMEVKVNEPFSFGAPERQRYPVQFGYDMRPSFWQKIKSNSHLVIAAVGTAALLGVAAVGLWLALPASDSQADASPAQTVPTFPVRTLKIAPAVAMAGVAAAPQAARKADAVSSKVVAAEVKMQELASDDPRWTESESKTASSPPTASSDQPATRPAQESPKVSAAFAEPAAQTDATTLLSKVAAPDNAATHDPTDGAQTIAASSTVRPPEPSPADEGDGSQAETKPEKEVAAAGAGRILRGVTMRSGPQNNAVAMTTIPAKAAVQLVSCKQWCQIVYNGRRGWVYKTFVKPDA